MGAAIQPVTYKLRPYQREAIDSIYRYFSVHPGNPVIAMPTGTGKSVVIGKFIEEALKRWPAQRVLMLTHVKELITQNAEKLNSLWPGAPIGIFSAGLKRKEAGDAIVFGGVQSVARLLQKNNAALGKRDLIVIDECHLLSPNNKSQYQQVLKHLREINVNTKVIGLTATPYRMKTGSIADGEDGLFDGLAYNLCSLEKFNQLLDDGYLAPLVPKRPGFIIDTDSVKITGGDFNSKQLSAVVDQGDVTYRAVKEIVECGQHRKAWLIFAMSIEHAHHVCEALRSFGISAEVVHSKLSIEENDKRIRDFKDGHIRALVNMNKLTTGFDYPGIDLIGMLRPTMSVGLWVQMLGRGTRPAPGKNNCLVLDFAGNTERLGPINDPVIPVKGKKRKRKGEAPIKICPECDMYCHTSVRVCPACGHKFEQGQNLRDEASTDELIRATPVVGNLKNPFSETEPATTEAYEVNHITYDSHMAKGKFTPTLKVVYYCGLNSKYTEFICFEHSGYARGKAVQWWKRRCPQYDAPPTVADAVKWSPTLLQRPKSIVVSKTQSSKYPKIIGYRF